MVFADIHPIELAQQMTIIESNLFRNIRLSQLVAFHEERTAVGSKLAIVERFNQVSRWVTTEIVLQANTRRRMYMMKRFIRIAQVCKRIRDCFKLLSHTRNAFLSITLTRCLLLSQG